ncbi:TPR protein [Salix suchowensis]|nr:TPR protein [Salix suchowensis]
MASQFTNPMRLVDVVQTATLVYPDSSGALKMLSPIRHHILNSYSLDSAHLAELESYYITCAQCLRGLSEVLRVKDKYADAREMLEKAYVEFKTLGNMFWQAQCLKSLADLLLREDKYKEASTTSGSRRAVSSNPQPLGLAECHQLRRSYCSSRTNSFGRRRLTGARRTRASPRLFNKIEKPFYRPSVSRVGELLSTEENYPEAEAKLKEAAEEFVRLDNQIGEAQCLKTLGNILQLEDKYSEASEVLERAFVLFDDIEDTLGEAQCLRSLAEVLRLQSRYAEAHEKVQRSHEASSRIGDSLGIAQSLQVLGEILRMEGKTTEAFGKLQEALDLFDSIGDAVGAEQVEETLQAMKKGSDAKHVIYVVNN